MIVSTATADLPVWRSPMISSRWPRPMGTMESIDFRPVCTGCDTDWRAITPGATFSMTSVSLALIGPLPSIGWPSAFTTRPISSGPTGTSRMRPVHLTVSPSEMCSYSPRITEPTESRSRFSARPKVGWPSLVAGNSSISPAITSDRPGMGQMPSVTDTTLPWLRMSAAAPRPSMRLLISSEISAGLSCMAYLSWSRGQRHLHLFQTGLDRGVEHFVADHHANAADELRLHHHVGVELAVEALLERRHDLGQLRAVDRVGAVDGGVGHARHRVDEDAVLRRDLRHGREPPVVDDGAQQVLHGRRQHDGLQRAGRHVEDGGRLDLRVVGQLAQLRQAGDLRHRVELVGQLARIALPGGLEQRLRVRTRDGCKLGHDLQLGLETIEQVGVDRRGDLAAQDLLRGA